MEAADPLTVAAGAAAMRPAAGMEEGTEEAGGAEQRLYLQPGNTGGTERTNLCVSGFPGFRLSNRQWIAARGGGC